jgi:hypothetical protein
LPIPFRATDLPQNYVPFADQTDAGNARCRIAFGVADRSVQHGGCAAEVEGKPRGKRSRSMRIEKLDSLVAVNANKPLEIATIMDPENWTTG